jgi:hypothetical protein
MRWAATATVAAVALLGRRALTRPQIEHAYLLCPSILAWNNGCAKDNLTPVSAGSARGQEPPGPPSEEAQRLLAWAEEVGIGLHPNVALYDCLSTLSQVSDHIQQLGF